MRRVLRFLRFCLWSLLFVVALGGVLFGYYVYSPAPEVPRLSGTLAKGTIEVGGQRRTYLTANNRGRTTFVFEYANVATVRTNSGARIEHQPNCDSANSQDNQAQIAIWRGFPANIAREAAPVPGFVK